MELHRGGLASKARARTKKNCWPVPYSPKFFTPKFFSPFFFFSLIQQKKCLTKNELLSLLKYVHYNSNCPIESIENSIDLGDACRFRRRTPTVLNTPQSTNSVQPDGVQRGLVGTVISRFEQRGYKLVGMKMTNPTEELLREHYTDLQTKPFFPSLLKYMMSGPVVATVWEGKDAVRQGRVIVGSTSPLEAAPGTIRGDYAITVGRNIIHAR